MKTSETGLALIRAFEGKRLTGYLDAVGIPTIGWGHTEMAGGVISYASGAKTTKVFVGQSISELEARRIHEGDMVRFEQDVIRLLKRSPRQAEYDAMVALAFNIGVGAFGKSSVLRKFNAGDATGTADAFLMWNKAGGKVLSGLTRRRNAERALFLGDIALASKYTGVALPGYGSRLEPAVIEKPEETGAKPDEVQGKPAIQSTTNAAAVALGGIGILGTLGDGLKAAKEALAPILDVIPISPAWVVTGITIALAGWIIRERMRHAQEAGV